MPFWKNFSGTVLVGTLIAAGALLLNASLEKVSVFTYWSQVVGGFITLAQELVKLTDSSVQWGDLKEVLIYQGPFFFISTCILLFWFNVGLAAHLGWVSDTHPYSSRSLRGLKFPQFFGLLFVVLFALNAAHLGQVHHLISGLFRIVGTILFMQGMVTLSTALSIKGTKRTTRALVYFFSCTVAFYAVIGLGVLSPWFFKNKGNRLDNVPVVKLEEVSV